MCAFRTSRHMVLRAAMSLPVLFLLLAGLPLQVAGQTADLPAEVLHYPDMIAYNGKVITADDAFSIKEAFAVRDGKFLAVGDSARIRKMAGPATKQIDLAGKSVIPGIIDTHFHLDRYINVNQSGTKLKWASEETGLQELKALAEKTAPGEWVVAQITRTAIYTMTRQKLDQASTRHPIAVISPLGDEFAVNTEGLKKFPPGIAGLQKDAQGDYTGQVRSYASGVLDYELLPWPNIADQLPAYRETMKKYAKVGMTTTVHRARGMVNTAYRELWLRNELTMRVRLGHEFVRLNPNVEAMYKRFGNFTGLGDDWIKIIGVSPLPPDGAGSLVWTFQKQLQRMPDDPAYVGPYGQDLWGMMGGDLEKDTEFRSVVLAGKYGWTVNTLHSAGDAANQQALAAYEKALQASKDHGLTISIPYGLDHGAMITPEQIKKFKELGAIPSLYMAGSIGKDPSRGVYLYGADAVNRWTPTKSLIEAGVKPVAESDTAELPYTGALWNIEKYVTRTDEKGKVWGKDQAISRQQALWMHTNWAAYYTGDQKVLGTIEPSKLADFVILEDDFMRVPDEQISEIPIAMTVVGGKVVYDAATDGR